MKLKKILFTIMSALSIIINYRILYNENILMIFNDQYLGIRIILFLIAIIFLYYLYHKSYPKNKIYIFMSLFYTLLLEIGICFRNYGSIKIIFTYKVFYIILSFIGIYKLILCLIYKINDINKSFIITKDIPKNKFVKVFEKHSFLIPFCIMIACWIPYYIAFYPIVLSPDPSYQIKQFMGEKTKYLNYSVQINDKVTITNHHPVLHTVLLGTSVKLGKMLHNDNLGLFIYSFTQGIFMAFTLSYTIYFLKKKKVPNKYLFLMLLIYSFVPMFPFYAVNANKDVYYTMFIIHLLILLFDLVSLKKNTKLSIFKLTLWFIIMLFICLFRNNGIYIIFILLPFILLVSHKNLKGLLTIFLLVILSYFSYSKVLLPKLGITGTSIRESMSIFFQTTSRYVINHEDELSKDDKEIIKNIINYDIIKEKYNPTLADPIKNTFNKNATSEDLSKFIRLWFKNLFKHPITYIDGALNNFYGYFDPGDFNWYIYSKYDTRITQNNLVDYHYNNLDILRNILTYNAVIYPFLPIIGLISNIGFSFWLIFAITIYLIINKKYKYITTLIPLYVSILVCIVSPANTYFRYAMPYVFSMPFIIGYIYYIYLNDVKK